MIKSVLSDSFGFDEQVAMIVPLLRSGIDRGWLQKRAAAEQLFDFDRLASEARPGETLVHLLALGDGETVGANRNGDYFPKAANVKYHPTFKKAHYFHNHDNKDPKKAFGRVVAAAHNGPMGRVELIVGLDNDKCTDDLDDLEKKGEFPVSMSCRVPYDECMVCGNRAKTRKDYCKHASVMMGRILQNGKQACVRNDHPDFFDISRVWRGADRVAFTFRKLEKAAAEGRTPGGAELAELFGYVEAAIPIIRSGRQREKQAAMREMSAERPWLVLGLCAAMKTDEVDDREIEILKSSGDLGPVFTALHREGVCLPLMSFLKLADIEMPTEVPESAVRNRLEAIFSKDSAELESVCSNGSYDGTSGRPLLKVADAARRLRSEFGLFPSEARDRVMVKAARDGLFAPAWEKSAGDDHPAAISIANEYAAYLVSMADASGRVEPSHSGFVRNLTALRALV